MTKEIIVSVIDDEGRRSSPGFPSGVRPLDELNSRKSHPGEPVLSLMFVPKLCVGVTLSNFRKKKKKLNV